MQGSPAAGLADVKRMTTAGPGARTHARARILSRMPSTRPRDRSWRALPWLAGALLLFALAWQLQRPATAPAGDAQALPAGSAAAHDAGLPGFLPAEAAPVIRAIQRGEGFAHRQDGSVFGNRERRLPARGHGYYREYTVPTPGLSHRGARRIVTGGDPPREWYYTADHYDSFRRFEPPATEHGP